MKNNQSALRVAQRHNVLAVFLWYLIHDLIFSKLNLHESHNVVLRERGCVAWYDDVNSTFRHDVTPGLSLVNSYVFVTGNHLQDLLESAYPQDFAKNLGFTMGFLKLQKNVFELRSIGASANCGGDSIRSSTLISPLNLVTHLAPRLGKQLVIFEKGLNCYHVSRVDMQV